MRHYTELLKACQYPIKNLKTGVIEYHPIVDVRPDLPGSGFFIYLGTGDEFIFLSRRQANYLVYGQPE